jgi:hypothetical protein
MSARERVIRLSRTMTSTPARRLVTAGAALGIAGAVAAYGVLILSTINAPPPAGLSSSGGIGLSTARPLTPNRSNEVACAGSFEPSTSFGRGPEGAWVVAGNGTGGFVGYRAAEILAFEFVRDRTTRSAARPSCRATSRSRTAG